MHTFDERPRQLAVVWKGLFFLQEFAEKSSRIDACYHFFATATKLENLKKPLGHDIELSISYTFDNFVKLGAGYTFMYGTETMKTLQKLSQSRTLHWGWIMLSVTPTIFTTQWNDKKKNK